MTLVALVGVLAILYAWQLWPFTGSLVTTENAYVRGQLTVLAPQVAGYVTEVRVQDFEQVRQGQVLVRIDDRQYQQRVAQRRAERDAARFELENLDQQLAADRATLAARRADLFAAKAEEAQARADERRVDELAQRGSVSIREARPDPRQRRAASANVRKARAAIEIAEQTLKASGISGAACRPGSRSPRQRCTRPRSTWPTPRSSPLALGGVSEVGVRLGQYVTAGTQLLFLVPPKLWVIANYKETQTANMRPGQPVSFEVDALNGARLTGRIERIAPATGSEFSLLRPDNATGNFTKVVQRLPVRIAIDPDQPLLGACGRGCRWSPRGHRGAMRKTGLLGTLALTLVMAGCVPPRQPLPPKPGWTRCPRSGAS